MTNPYATPPTPRPSRPAPRWARKRYALPALALALFAGVGIGAGGQDQSKNDARPAVFGPAAQRAGTGPAGTRTLPGQSRRNPTGNRNG
ncbi:hypothetical protein GCM10010508_45270 [Streptomyces naganishii JCM 4654]|uniref:Uncharacterized protein n=1 Tax=Streptomyces naganishii JCM 4654 TaxID=1306179 RepID=A0A918Y847_9ACTN|nr:hypothetical protein GCM10010508_45270 [Streptomyces naganishii JCM 4654]